MTKKLTILSPCFSSRHHLNSKSIERLATCRRYDLALFECFGFSQVANARNHLVTAAHDYVQKEGGLVFWWDSDMVLTDINMFHLHYDLVYNVDVSIGGRYVQRMRQSRIAAAIDDLTTESKRVISFATYQVELTPTLVGMGALLMPSGEFLAQARNSPTCTAEEGKTDILACCPKIVPHKDTHVLLGEDFDYCQSLPNGSWMAHVTGDGWERWLDYGHIGEKVLLHSPKQHELC